MKVVVQRVAEASVSIAGDVCAKIDRGLLVLVGIEQGDDQSSLQRCAQKLLSFRVFSDQQGKMNLDVRAAGGALLVVSQFTLAADTARGNRPGFSSAAAPEQARALYEDLVTLLRAAAGVEIQTGVFAADMQVALINDGPVTFTFSF